jgi:hypothetical protein
MIDPELRNYLNNLHMQKSWREIAQELGVVSFGVLYAIANGKQIGIETLNVIREELGWPKLIHPALAPYLCTTCGKLHAVGDCKGIQGVPIMAQPKRMKPRPPQWVEEATDNLFRLRQKRREEIQQYFRRRVVDKARKT